MEISLHETVNQKIQLLVHHFINRNDEIFLNSEQNRQMAELFVKITLVDCLFDEKHIITENEQNNYQAQMNECMSRFKMGEDIAQELLDVIANSEANKYRLEIPYEDITQIIYAFEDDILPMSQKFDGFEFELKDAIPEDKIFEKRKVEKAYKKFKRHLKLAVAQKAYFTDISKQAKIAAQKADEQSENAKAVATKANTAAEIAENLAKSAEDQAKSAIVSYITILGIFATIIITVFGGLNIIGSTVKLLEGTTKLSYLVFVISFLMACLFTLVRMLTTWISSINATKTKETSDLSGWERFKMIFHGFLDWSLYTKAMLVLLVLILGSLICVIKYSAKTIETPSQVIDKERFHNQTETGINININPSKETDKSIPQNIASIKKELIKISEDDLSTKK